uniref:Uncharacterized protein n=1 Tax=Anguilla anguilla TaxID=7936 RepID=A0A0E9T9R6_ANGAN
MNQTEEGRACASSGALQSLRFWVETAFWSRSGGLS